MTLTDKQRSDLHIGIYDYFLSRGEVFASCAKALAEADPEVVSMIRHPNNTTNINKTNNSDTAAAAGDGVDEEFNKSSTPTSPPIITTTTTTTPILEKKWTAVPRLQRRVLELERQLSSLSTNRNTSSGGTAADTSGRMIRENQQQRRHLPRPPATHTLRGHSSVVTSVAIHPIYTLVASGSEDGTIKLWDYESGEYLRTLRGHTNTVTSVDFSPRGGEYLVSSSSDLSIKLWDMMHEQYTCMKTLRGHDHTISCVKFVPPNADAVYLVESSSSGSDYSREGGGGGGDIKSGSTTSGGADPMIAGSKFLISASRDQTVKFWDIETGFCDHTLSDHGDWVRCLAVRSACSSSSSSIVAPAPSSSSSSATTVTTTRRKNVGFKDGDKDIVEEDSDNNNNNSTFSSSTSSLALVASSGNDRTIYVYNAHEKREKVCELRGHDHVVESISFLCSALMPQKTSSSTASSTKPSSTIASSSSLIRDYLASGSRDRTVRLWSITNGGSCLMTFRGHENWVRSVIVHPSGNYIVSCGDDRSIRIFDIKNNRCLRTMEDAHSHFVTSLAMHSTMPIMISGGVDTTLKCWQLD